ncbi:MAG: hypothetical protein KJO60_11030 [Desulfofustis sp.]|nr:hypothetical protein [Desulfofustis sp.]
MTYLVMAISSISFAAENAFLQFNSDVEKAYAAISKAINMLKPAYAKLLVNFG